MGGEPLAIRKVEARAPECFAERYYARECRTFLGFPPGAVCTSMSRLRILP